MACPCIAHGAQGAIVASARRQAALAAPNAGILVRGRPHRALAASAPRSTFAGALVSPAVDGGTGLGEGQRLSAGARPRRSFRAARLPRACCLEARVPRASHPCRPVPAPPAQIPQRAAAASPAEAPQAGRTSVGTPATTARKTRVVVLGSGWGAVAFIKNIDAAAFAGGPHVQPGQPAGGSGQPAGGPVATGDGDRRCSRPAPPFLPCPNPCSGRPLRAGVSQPPQPHGVHPAAAQ